jgi:ABC-type nitrate/sulfonate/bicarbonate transport system substrate-binding protein
MMLRWTRVAALCLLGSAALAAHGTQAADLAPLKLQVYQGGPQILPLIAQNHGFFDKNGVKVEFVTVQTGPQAANALVSGSIDLAILAPINVGPLLTQDIKLTAIAGLQRIFVSLVGSKGASTTWPDTLRQLKGKRIGVLAVGAAGHLICDAAIQAAGLQPSDYTFVGTGTELGSATALEQGSVDAACINPQARIPMAGKGFPVLFDFLEPNVPAASLPASFQPMLNLSFVQLWARSDWAQQNRDTVGRFMKAMAQAWLWMEDPANLQTVAQDVRGSIWDIPSFQGKDYDAYIRSMVIAHSLLFTKAEGAAWVGVVKAAMKIDLPPPAQWVSPDAPASREDLAKLAGH